LSQPKITSQRSGRPNLEEFFGALQGMIGTLGLSSGLWGKYNDMVDQFLKVLLDYSVSKIGVYELIDQTAFEVLNAHGTISGPVHRASGDLTVILADGLGIPSEYISRRLVLPTFIDIRLTTGRWERDGSDVGLNDWEGLRPLVAGNKFQVMCHPFRWNGRLQGAFLAWRSEGAKFTPEEDAVMGRLANIAALALNAVD
jgi:hypothetical protein